MGLALGADTMQAQWYLGLWALNQVIWMSSPCSSAGTGTRQSMSLSINRAEWPSPLGYDRSMSWSLSLSSQFATWNTHISLVLELISLAGEQNLTLKCLDCSV